VDQVDDAASQGADAARVDHWLERLSIASIADRYPGEISGGQRQRCAIARTLALGPDLLLMDEPFASLDALIREDLRDLTLELCREGGLTLVLVTHSIEEAARVGRRILVLGRAPNRGARILDNPAFGNPDPGRPPSSGAPGDGYGQLCASLRAALGDSSGEGR
jgi:NitT/TauT family transport system ATP-binding protein